MQCSFCYKRQSIAPIIKIHFLMENLDLHNFYFVYLVSLIWKSPTVLNISNELQKWNIYKMTLVLILWQIIIFSYFNKKISKGIKYFGNSQKHPQSLPQTLPQTPRLLYNSHKSETILAPPGYWTRASLHRSSLSYPLGHWHLNSKWQKKAYS